jgi:hypothetical protein
MQIRQPTLFLDLNPAPAGTNVPDAEGLPDRNVAESELTHHLLGEFLNESRNQRSTETQTVRQHLRASLEELINRQNLRMSDLHEQLHSGGENPNLIQANIKTTQDRIDDLTHRMESRLRALDQECQVSIADTVHLGSAWVLPHPERTAPTMASMVSDPEIERIAVDAVIAYEESRGWRVISVEKDNKGFDLISRRYLSDDPDTYVESRFIEVKGRAKVGEVALTDNEYKTAVRLRDDYWLYVVYNCATAPEIHIIRDPAQLTWQAVVKVEHYLVGAKEILGAEGT